MGTDIHLAVERWTEEGWKNMRRPEPVPLWEGAEATMTSWYERRNYDLFGVLADVRRRRAHLTNPARRGLPADADPASLEADRTVLYYDNVADGQHSASWALLSEVLNWTGWRSAEDMGEERYLLSLLTGSPPYDPALAKACGSFLTAMLEVEKYAREAYGLTPGQVRLIYNFDS